MKSLNLTLILLLGLYSWQCLAVQTKNCPKEFNLILSELKIVSAEKLEQELGNSFDARIEVFRKSLEEKSDLSYSFVLDNAKSGRCIYKISTGGSGEGVLATTNGSDWFRISVDAGFNGRWEDKMGAYLSISQYSLDGMSARGSAFLGWENPNHPGNFDAQLGFANQVEFN